MRLAICPMALAIMLTACASMPKETAALSSAGASQADFAALSCRQITAELDLTQKAYARATGRQRPPLVGEPMASLYAPISYATEHPTQANRLKARLDELQRASRAKRCASSGVRTATA
jgi:hypothetical protein